MRTSLSVASSLKRPRSHDTTTKPIMTSWRGLRRLLGDMGRLFLLGLVISAMALMLPNRPPQEPPPGGAYAGDESRVGGMPVYSKVLHIWLSERLADVAKREPLARLVQGHQDPDVALTRQEDPSLFYALAVREYRVDGKATDIGFFRSPYLDREYLQEFLGVLATAGGFPPRYPTLDFSRAKVHIVPATMSRREVLDLVQASADSLAPVPPGQGPSP